MDPDKVKAFLAEYRDLVHRHGLGFTAVGVANAIHGDGDVKIVEISDPDAHVAEIADERPSETKAKGRRGHGKQSA